MHRTRTTTTRTTTRKTLSAAVGLTLLAALVAGCGDDSDNDGDKSKDAGSDVPALTADQLAEVVLDENNMGPDWTGTPGEDSDALGPGCIGEVKQLTDSIDETDKERIDYTFQGGAPYLSSSASAYPDEKALADVFDQVEQTLGDCTSVTGTDSDGWEYDLQVTYDDTIESDSLDGEIRVRFAGTVTAEGQSQEISQAITMFRMGPNIVQVALSANGDLAATDSIETYGQIALDRLLAVAAGEQPAETTAPAPA